MVFQLLNLPVLDLQPLLQCRGVFHCCYTFLRRCLLCRAKVSVAVVFSQGGGALIFLAACLFLGAANLPVVFLGEYLYGFLPRMDVALVIVLQELVFIEAAQIHLADEEYGFSTFNIVTVNSLHSSCRSSSCVANVLACALGVSDQGASN